MTHNLTVTHCSKCGAELNKVNRYYCGKWNITECPSCRHLEALGITTTEQYNDYISKGEPNGCIT